MAADTSTGSPYSGTAYVDSDQTQDLYPISFAPALSAQSVSFTAPATRQRRQASGLGWT